MEIIITKSRRWQEAADREGSYYNSPTTRVVLKAARIDFGTIRLIVESQTVQCFEHEKIYVSRSHILHARVSQHGMQPWGAQVLHVDCQMQSKNHLHGGVGVLEDSYVILLESCRSVMLRSIVTEAFVPTQILPGIGWMESTVIPELVILFSALVGSPVHHTCMCSISACRDT